MLQHGLLDPVMYEEMLESEHFFAFGNKQAEMVAEMQHNKNVHVTGTGIFCDRKPEKADGHGKYALLLTQPLVEDNAVSKERYFQYIRKIIGRLRDDGFEARIKMHPSEGKLDDYRKLGVEVHHAGATMKNTESLQDLIRDSCICLSFGSTAMFDAILLGKATILIEIPEYSSRIFEIENMDIPKMKIDEISFKDLRGTAAREKAAKVAQGSLRDFLHEPGKGTQNIIKKINELMKG